MSQKDFKKQLDNLSLNRLLNGFSVTGFGMFLAPTIFICIIIIRLVEKHASKQTLEYLHSPLSFNENIFLFVVMILFTIWCVDMFKKVKTHILEKYDKED